MFFSFLLLKKNCGIPGFLKINTIWHPYWVHFVIQRVRQITFFLENAVKKTTISFLNFLFLFKSTILPVNNGK